MNLDRARIKLIRKEILRILDHSYARGANAGLIATSLLEGAFAMTEGEVDEELIYLADKGYIYLQKFEDPVLGNDRVARLSPKGKDLLEGNIERDPGIL